MDIAALQKELEMERAARTAAEVRISKLNEELEYLNRTVNQIEDNRKTVERANNWLNQLVGNLQNGIFAVDENRTAIIVNDFFCRLFGLKAAAADLIGLNGAEISEEIKHLYKKPQQFIDRTNELIANKKIVFNDEFELVTGQIISRDFIPLFSNDHYTGHLWKFTDITRNRTIEATFEAQRKFYEQILNNTPADIIVCTPDYQYLYLNPTAVSDPELRKWMIGKNNEEYCRHTKRPAELAEGRRAFFNLVTETKTQQEREEKIVDADGHTEYHLRKMYPVLDDHGDVEMVVGYGVNITERKKIEEQILLSEKRYREIFSFSQAWIGTHDMQGRFLSINPAACKILGYTEQELLGKKMDFLIPEKYRAQFSGAYLKQIYAEGKAEGIMNVLNKEVKPIYLLYQNYLVNEPGSEPYVIGFAQNITERIHAEEALKRSEEKYRGIIENMNLGMIEIDPDERIIYANQRFCTMSGYELDELISKKATDLFLQGASLKKTRNQLSKRRFGITNSYELAVRTKDGEDKWWLTSAAPVFGPGESVKGTIGIHLDITDQKKLEEQLREAKHNADNLTRSKDIFLTNMSHEIRTPLNAIMGLGKLLSKDNLSPKQKNYLAGIESASASLLAIINDLLDFSKIEAGKITIENISFNLEVITAQVISILTHKAEEKGLALSYEIDSKIAPVLIGDPYRVNQVFMNLLSNSIKFTEKGSVCLKAFFVDEAEDYQTIRIVVEDTGIGIKDEYLDKLFDKFTQEDETVVRKFGGTGLGMSISKQLMELMGGSITVASEKNKGTAITLTFRFKIGASRVIEKKRTIKNDTSQINNRKILLVEDNSLNRLLAYTILTEYGAIVSEAENGAEAVEIMRKENFDIVLMDIQMPVMDGIMATQIIRSEISKTIPVIALTANAIKGKEDQFLDGGMNDYIVKPYSEINLVNPIAKWLGKSASGHVADAVQKNDADDPLTKEETASSITEPAGDQLSSTTGQTGIPLYDLGKLMNIARNDSGFITKMLQLFISETGPALIKINEAYDAGDLKTVKYYAHRMKPSISNLGIGSIKKEVLEIEFLQEKTPEMKEKVAFINTTLSNVIAQLKLDYNL